MLIQVKARRCFGDIPRPISCVQAALHGAHQVPSCQMQVHLLNSVQHRCRLRSGVVECSLCSADAALYIIPTSVVSHVHVCVLSCIPHRRFLVFARTKMEPPDFFCSCCVRNLQNLLLWTCTSACAVRNSFSAMVQIQPRCICEWQF